MDSFVKYIAYFDFQDSPISRNYVPSATNKIESICEMLNEAGFVVQLISMSEVTEKKLNFHRGENIKRTDRLSLQLFPSWGGSNRLLNYLKILWHLVCLFFYLLFHAKKDEPVIVYHSLGYYKTILWAKKIKKFKLILEVEEFYNDINSLRFKGAKKLEREIIEAADAYIFPTELMDTKFNPENKPSVIIYGTYNIEPILTDKFTDGDIHVVYAGTFDPSKGGAQMAVKSAEFLPENYHIHICGFGTDDDKELMKALITELQSKSKCKISFEGLIKGKDYLTFIQKCHIGLSCQNPDGEYNNTSFPSKILSYMGNGISVVSISLPVIKASMIYPYIDCYYPQNPQKLSCAIIKCSIHNNNRDIIKILRSEFIESLPKLM